MNDTATADCRKCSYYYITWDENFPYGCKAMKFKSKYVPDMEVRLTSGKDCLSFAARDEKIIERE